MLHFDAVVEADVVSLGGKIIGDEGKLKRAAHYKDCFSKNISCFAIPPNSTDDNYNFVYPDELHIPLSGCAAFDASKFQDCTIDEAYKYAADIQLGKWIADKGLKARRAWSYRKNLVKYNPKMQGKETIYDNHTKKEGKRLSDLVRGVWQSREESLSLK